MEGEDEDEMGEMPAILGRMNRMSTDYEQSPLFTKTGYFFPDTFLLFGCLQTKLILY